MLAARAEVAQRSAPDTLSPRSAAAAMHLLHSAPRRRPTQTAVDAVAAGAATGSGRLAGEDGPSRIDRIAPNRIESVRIGRDRQIVIESAPAARPVDDETRID